MLHSEEERMDYSQQLYFSESDRPSTRLLDVSENTKKLLHEKCTWKVPNSERKQLQDPYPLSKVPATRTPQHYEVLVQCLGFRVNQVRSILTLAQVMEFLDLTVDTVQTELKLPLEKIKKDSCGVTSIGDR